MRNPISALSRLAVVLTGALALGSCSRAEYAFLPRSASYLGATTAASKARAAAPTPAFAAQAPTSAVAPEITVATSAPAPSAVKATTPVAPRPTVPPPAPVDAAAAAAPVTAPATAATPPKPSLVQRLALAKVMKKLNKLAVKAPQLKKGDATASTARLDGNLRYAIIFGVLSLVFFTLGGSLLNLIGTVLLVIAVLFLLFWVLDAL